MKTLLMLFFLFFSIPVVANEYYCSYQFNDEEFPLTFKKKTDYSYTFEMNYETEEYILGETSDLLIVGAPQLVEDDKVVFRVIFLDKINKLLSITSVIEPNFNKDYIRGIWGDVIGKCE